MTAAIGKLYHEDLGYSTEEIGEDLIQLVANELGWDFVQAVCKAREEKQ